MSGDGSPIRSQGEAHRSPMQQRLIQAMERRATNLQGAAKQNVLDRLSSLADAQPSRPVPADAQVPAPPAQPALCALLDYIAQSSGTSEAGDAGPSSAGSRTHIPPMAALGEVQQLWSRLRSESQAREALAAEPTDAGPLNSAQLVHRALNLMRETSPEYLRHFLSYVDALSWLAEITPEPGKTSPAPVKGRARSKPKKRRE